MNEKFINEKLRQARYDRRWSIDEAAKRIGISRTTYIRWEQGEQAPHGSTLSMACDAFNMTPEQLGFREYTNALSPISRQPSLVSATGVEHEASSVDMFSIGIIALILAQRQYGWTFDELQVRTEQEIGRLTSMTRQDGGNHEAISRREALRFLIGLPVAYVGLTQPKSMAESIPAFAEEILPLYVASIPACWKLYYSGPKEWQEIENVLPTSLSHLTSFTQRSSPYQRNAASLLSQAHQLAAEITLTREDFNASLRHGKLAYHYGVVAKDVNLCAASLIREGNTLYYRKRSTLQLFENMVQYVEVNDVSPLLKARAYSELAASYAELGRVQEALRYMGLSYETIPVQPDEDLTFPYTHSNHYVLYFNDMLCYTEFGKPKEAWKALTTAEAFLPGVITPRKMEVLKYYVLTAMAFNDLERCLTYFKTLVDAVSTFDADLHVSQAHEVHQQLLVKWPHESAVRALADLLPF